jgi:glutamyl-Q tRNA(Asp) synthetase
MSQLLFGINLAYDCIGRITGSRGEMDIEVVTRFAPSPTGLLHLGHAWSALQAYDVAQQAGGRFLLRIEDIDRERCRPAYGDAILRDLDWLNLPWDGDVRYQSTRGPYYDGALQTLIEAGFAYQCWCTRAEILATANGGIGDDGPLYPGTCKGRRAPGDGRPSCWRLDADAAAAAVGPLTWDEEGRGPLTVDPNFLGDVVIARKDALSSYHMAVTVDDADQGVTHVVRGRDLFSSTHVHCVLQALLGFDAPHYLHHRLILGDDGTRLAKRKASPTLASLRDNGVDPVRLIDGMRQGRFPIGFMLDQA